jgi:hypothetical protein
MSHVARASPRTTKVVVTSPAALKACEDKLNCEKVWSATMVMSRDSEFFAVNLHDQS